MSLKIFTRAYIEAALWAETACGVPEDTGDGTWDTSWQSYGMDEDDLSPELLKTIQEDCRSFYEAFSGHWENDEQAGHDFWLTRNRHGAGFWDRGLAAGDFLTEMSHPYGEVHLYLGDDGLIYGS